MSVFSLRKNEYYMMIIRSFTSRMWCYGLALGIFFFVFACHAHSILYYIIPFSPTDVLIKIPSPIYLVCFLLDTVTQIASNNNRPFSWSDFFPRITGETGYGGRFD